MSKTERWSVLGEEHELCFRPFGNREVLSVDVKCRVNVQPGSKFKKRVTRLERDTPGTTAKFLDWAMQSVQDSWWAEAAAYASEQRLGDIGQDGRSGGHLVLTSFTRSRMQGLVDGIEGGCKVCNQPWKEHANGKCLFDTTNYVIRNTDDLALFNRVLAYLQRCRDNANLEKVSRAVSEAFDYYIESA